jgi:hypothetical protein
MLLQSVIACGFCSNCFTNASTRTADYQHQQHEGLNATCGMLGRCPMCTVDCCCCFLIMVDPSTGRGHLPGLV